MRLKKPHRFRILCPLRCAVIDPGLTPPLNISINPASASKGSTSEIRATLALFIQWPRLIQMPQFWIVP
ncbi:hypothetical protein ACK1VC_09590 [Pseudomonas sp. XP2]|uniref:Uncharacterized protein n=1 Tax=Pseudomonas putida TaxID=303 RepID=A0ABD7B6H9_PSEPU|nr:hypothetical protein [Pseudomonas putida]QOC96167.1 hypothetical protein ID616_18935 [Pseudomonas putida]